MDGINYGDDSVNVDRLPPHDEAPDVRPGPSSPVGPETVLPNEMYRTIFDVSPEAIVLVGPKGVFLAANGRMKDWLGYAPEELVGKSLLQAPFIPRESKIAIVRNFIRRMAGKHIPPYELAFITKSGEKRFGRIHASVLRGEHGRVQGDLVMISDVTELKQAEEALETSRHKIEGLHETARKLLACLTDDEVCHVTVDAVVGVLGFQTCVAHTAVGDGLVVRSGCSAFPPGVDMDETPCEGSSVMQAYREQKTVVFGSGGTSSCSSNRDLFRSGMCVPIADVGVFEVLSVENDAFGSEDVRLLELLVGHTSEAMRNIRLRQELSEQVIRDPLTGLYNRRYLSTIVEQEAERAWRYGHRIGMLMIDVDNFKEINDTLGHQVGDLVLRQVSRFLRAMVRAAEYVIRYGGDEFLLVMPESEDGQAVVFRLQRAFGPWIEELPTGDLAVRLSMGYDHWQPGDGRSVDEVIASADEKMYEDKKLHGAGRPIVESETSA